MATANCTISGLRTNVTGGTGIDSWTSSYSTSVNGYAGRRSGANTATVVKFTLPSFVGNSNFINFKLFLVKATNSPYRIRARILNSGTDATLRDYCQSDANGSGGTAGSVAGPVANSNSVTATGAYYTIRINTTSLVSGGTYYLMLYADTTTSITHVQVWKFSTNAPTFTLDYTPYTACGAPSSVSANLAIRIPNGNITLSWSGASAGSNNAITGYNIYQSDNNWSSSTLIASVSSSSTSGSRTMSASGTRAVTRRWKVVTKGAAGSGYYSGLSSAQGSTKTNSLPKAPSVSSNVSKVPSAGGSVTFTVTAGSDADGQKRTLYYSLTSGGSKTLFTSPLSRTMSTGSESLYFWTYDGLEFSSSTLKTITINQVPVLTGITATHTEIAGSPKDENYPLGISIAATATGVVNPDGDTLTYYWSYAQASSIIDIPTTGTHITSGSSASLSAINMSTYITAGNFFRIGVRVYDGYDYANNGDIVWIANGFQRPNTIGDIVINNLFNSNITANITDTASNQFRNNITLQWTNPTLGLGDANLANLTLAFATSVDGVTFGSFTNILSASTSYKNSGEQYSYNWTGASALSAGTYVRFRFTLVDTGGGTKNISSTSFSRVKAGAPNMPIGGTFSSIAAMNPLESSGNVSITFSSYEYFANLTPGNYNITNEETNYRLNLLLDGVSQSISLSQSNWSSSVVSSTFEIPYATLVNLATNLGKQNASCAAIFQIHVVDNFGTAGTILASASFTMDFRVRPTMEAVSTDNYGIQILYSDTILGSIMYTIGQTANSIMVNPGERIRFHFPAGSDLNGLADIVQYRIYINRSNTTTFGNLTELLSTKTVNNQSGTITFDYTVPVNTTAATFIKFAVQAVDATGLVSEVKREFPQYLVFSRVSLPAASTTNATLNGEDLSVTLTSFNLGGNSFVNPAYTYSGYPNLERTISGYTKRYSLVIEYCTDNLFDVGSGAEAYGTATFDYDSLAYNALLTGKTAVINSINSVLATASRIYIRTTLTLRTGLSTTATIETPDYITTEVLTGILVFYNSAPTISYRQNFIGINHRIFNEDDVLVISQTSTRNLIRFLGVYETVDSEVILNLSTGVITGASMSAASISVDVSSFSQNLSEDDVNVQLALETLDALVSSGGDVSGPASSIDGRIAFFDGETGKLLKDASAISITELGYVIGVTSDIQTQLNGKAASSHTHAYLPLAGGELTGSLSWNDNPTFKFNGGSSYAYFYEEGGNAVIRFYPNGNIYSVGTLYEGGTTLANRYLSLAGGILTGQLRINTSGKYYTIECANTSFAHHNTDANNGHWFNKAVYVAGEIYAGTGYNQKVWHAGNLTFQTS